MQDRLSALLDCFRLRARVFHTGSLCDTADFDARDGVGHLHVLRGGALRIGDAVAGETVVDAPSLIFYPRPAPHWIRGEGAMGAELVCSSIELGADAGNPLTRSLPARLVLPLRDHPLLHGTLTLLFEEAFAEHCGRQAALDRLSELMILQLLRHCMTAGVVAQGVLAGLADPRLAKALNALHGAPGEAWTLDGMARVSGMSRARFAAHFHHVVGMPPGEYLAEWRLSVAKTLLKRGQPPKQVALEIGYASPSAFARAFAARHAGVSPTAWLSASRASPAQ
ncbi:AraC family transcriptional regulator [Stenotrophomonas acidaminiphila]|uniref:AraC family transcriptional regulator n=1 Tax=Stenotrophomonas acidaminiphila TaxID=128780 RepID=UPI002ABDA29B|nr:AraC family transcriptional regulator [Stenotrophomonas acidaminiphila]WPU54475.1 AraC family transcriptional regulator [Stenotrophomonas acidaminiphila]